MFLSEVLNRQEVVDIRLTEAQTHPAHKLKRKLEAGNWNDYGLS